MAKKNNPIERVLKRECDVAMARKKGYLPCQQQCRPAMPASKQPARRKEQKNAFN